MTTETLRMVRNILLRSAALGCAYMLLSLLLWLPFADKWTPMTTTLYHIPPEKVRDLVVDFLTWAKFYTTFVLIVPALAIHWTLKHEAAKSHKTS